MEPNDSPPGPSIDETIDSYCERLQDCGYEEMTLRKCASEHFELPSEEAGEFYAKFKEARLRHIRILMEIAPNRTRYPLMKKVSKNLDIPEEEANTLIDLL